MRLKVLYCGQWQVVAPVASDGTCDLEVQLAALAMDKKCKAFVIGFRALWQRIPRHGPRGLGTDFYHCVDPDGSIYEFRKGGLRLLCFEADGAIVVCSHVFRKQSRKTPESEVRRALSLKKRFDEAHRLSKVLIED